MGRGKAVAFELGLDPVKAEVFFNRTLACLDKPSKSQIFTSFILYSLK